nr:collagen alpha-2(I) chain-like [Macaca fascicularis]
MLCPRFPFLPRRRLQSLAEADSPGPFPPVSKFLPQGPPGSAAEAPESWGTSPFPDLERSRADSAAQPPRPPWSVPRSCHPAAALLRTLGLSSVDPRAALARGGDRVRPRVLTPPLSGAARRRMSGARAAEGSRAGGCVRPRADPVPLGAKSPALAGPRSSAPRSQHPPPLAPEASTRPPPPLLCGSSDESGDGGGQTRTSPRRSASRPPPSYSHTPPPGAGSLKARGRLAQASPASGRGEEGGGEARRPTPTQLAALRWAPGRPSDAGSAPGTHWERAPRTPARRLLGAPWAVGALAKPGEWASRVLLGEGQGKGVVARCLAKPSPFSPTLSLTRPPVKGAQAQMSRVILNVRSCRPSATVTCASSAPQAPPLVSFTTGSPGGPPSLSIWMMSFSCQKLFNDFLQHLA